MNTRSVTLLFLLPFASVLAAQESPAGAMPNPKTPQHERLAAFVGTWRTESKMAAMPGVPGMEQPTELSGTETAELVCNGLWLKVTGEGVCAGQACAGLWLLGYDAIAKTYQCVAASNMEEAAFAMPGRYDEKAQVWHFQGDTPMGPFRSEFVFESADRSVETCFGKGEGGKETQVMRIVRTRVKGAVPTDAGAKPAAAMAADGVAPPAAFAALQAGFGTWDADWTMEMPGAPAMTAKCREVVGPLCAGKWAWSTFRGDVMGAPYEGHALTGYDRKADKVVSYWIDSMNGAYMLTEGAYDATKQTFTLHGTCYDESGKRSVVASTATATGKDARQLRMVFGEGAGQHVMTIAYRRAAK